VSSPRADGSTAAGPLARLRGLARHAPLAVRLSVLSAALAGAVVCATFTALNVQVRSSARQLFADELARNQRTLVALQRDSRRQLVLSAALLAESPSLRSAIATYRAERRLAGALRPDLVATVERQLDQLGRDLNAGALLATDEQGHVFAAYTRSGARVTTEQDLSTLAALRNALDPQVVGTREEAWLSGLEIGGDYYSVGVAPLIVDGFTVGALVFGQQADSSMVAALRNAFDGEVILSAGNHVISSTMPAAAARAAIAVQAGEGSRTIDGAEYLTAIVPLGRTQRGTDLRLTLLQPVGPSVQTLTSTLQRDFLLYGSLAVLLAALGAAVLSRSLLRPLRGFIAFMRDGAARERVDRHFDADDAAPEIRTLNDSFTGLIASLERKREELEQRGAELAAANEVLTDEIREREHVQGALRESEQQLRQSQKLEAVGTLAGGIAHDFNNLLTVISGFTQIAVSRLGRAHPVADDLRQVSDASASAAALTHQLLAFSRKQVMQPRVLDLEEVVGGMAVMLRRLIGAQVELVVTHSGEAGRIRADPGQLEQVVLNLAVNARDAMPEGGTLTIATGHRVDAAGTRQVTLTVSDTGTGMSREVQERIFEPFYTTKDVGKGTGLGLSTVYGIVAQSGGTIEVDSVLRRGTRFIVVFPYIVEALQIPNVVDEELAVPGTGTVLVVEDNDAVRTMVEYTLSACGYRVIAVRSAVEALARARTEDRIDVLLTDIVMPQMSGPQLVERYLARFPTPEVIYMTGHVNESVMRLELDAETVLLRKPFTPAVLARTVRAALDHRTAPVALPHPGR
jgi:signal transduction histidine kinase/ActR/RegA family two-component response regulator